MSEVQKLITRYSRDFSGNISVDPNGSWVLAADAAIRDKRLTDQLAALREELAIVNREKNDVAYRANETAEKLNSMTISKATMRNQLKQKLASTQQRLADAERRNSALMSAIENHLKGTGNSPGANRRYAELRAALTKPEEAKS